ncbi:MAG: hypothetical protein PWQ97_1662 [Tepidanaerobacteraceae bacterium]|nr:hypothetical protein [Tepidanaerobacteraceae bacterium]
MEKEIVFDDLKKHILDKAYERGYYYEGQYRGCSQAVVAAVSELFDVDEIVFKAASGFSGGIADEAKGTCGAFAGGIMIISYFFGRDLEHYGMSGSKFRYRELVRKLRRLFNETYGGETCPAVQKFMFGRNYDISNPDEKKAFEEAGAHRDKCTHVVGTAAKWIAEILLAENIPLKKTQVQ